VQFRSLGNSDIEVSALGLGCWAIGGPYWHNGNANGWGKVDDNESISGIHKAIDNGVNFFDTADIYGCGHSEKILAKAIQGKRDQMIIATKFGITFDELDRSVTGECDEPEYIRKACEASLSRLDTDYIDLYQFHLGHSDNGEIVCKVLEDLVLEGKIRSYGWSTDSPERAKIFSEGPHCVSIQQKLNVIEGNLETLKICENNNLASINRGPLAMGILTGKFTSNTTFPSDDVRSGFMNLKKGVFAERLNNMDAISEILTSNGRTLAQGSLCWLWAKSECTIPIPGYKTVEQVIENTKAASFGPLTVDQLEEIEKLILFEQK
jgi:aryl-alcohol dehydrogenase-like predicted oxidoreductase|tara:strand:+ start:1025 stop:1990 length:966 start_codon:yes stop_codon:yes gene_type:complete